MDYEGHLFFIDSPRRYTPLRSLPRRPMVCEVAGLSPPPLPLRFSDDTTIETYYQGPVTRWNDFQDDLQLL